MNVNVFYNRFGTVKLKPVHDFEVDVSRFSNANLIRNGGKDQFPVSLETSLVSCDFNTGAIAYDLSTGVIYECGALDAIARKEIDLMDPVSSNRNIYKIMDQSSLIISFGSTAPREAFGFGKKVLYCDFTGTDLYNDYDPIILFRDENYDLFKERLDKLICTPQVEYEEKTKEYASYLMNYDSGYPAHLLIREKIEYYLSKTDQN